MSDYKCPLCEKEATEISDKHRYPNRDTRGICCERCGEYYISDLAEKVGFENYSKLKKAMVSCLTRERSEMGKPLVICTREYKRTSKDDIGIGIDELLDILAPHSASDKLDRALLNLARKSNYFGHQVQLYAKTDWPLLFAVEPGVMNYILSQMEAFGLIEIVSKYDGGGVIYVLTVSGWDLVEKLKHLQPESRQAFVAMWFNSELDKAFEIGIKTAIEDAGYDVMRVDMSQFNGKIDDFIIAEIRRSKFLVADVTGHRQAVYFEAGFAMGLGLPVIFICHEKYLEECNFDTRQYNHIVWETPDDLRGKLRNRIEATIT